MRAELTAITHLGIESKTHAAQLTLIESELNFLIEQIENLEIAMYPPSKRIQRQVIPYSDDAFSFLFGLATTKTVNKINDALEHINLVDQKFILLSSSLSVFINNTQNIAIRTAKSLVTLTRQLKDVHQLVKTNALLSVFFHKLLISQNHLANLRSGWLATRAGKITHLILPHKNFMQALRLASASLPTDLHLLYPITPSYLHLYYKIGRVSARIGLNKVRLYYEFPLRTASHICMKH
jgi:hypothetical protein